ncbi:MAG: hypothetical protein V7607_5432 [Solirubrobacteraceae bacterium]
MASGTPLSEAGAEGQRIVEAAQRAHLGVFLLGGVAVKVRAPRETPPLFERELNDIDIVTTRAAGKQIAGLLGQLGYVADRQFNAINGRTRMLFRDEVNARDLDVLIGEFAMCHALPILERATLGELTIPLGDLLLTKLQIVEMNRKDVLDIYNILRAHELRVDGPGRSSIDARRIACLCARDWGLWRTVTRNLGRLLVAPYRPEALAAESAEVVQGRIEALSAEIEGAAKPARWRLRDRIGERVRWYDEPEEAH